MKSRKYLKSLLLGAVVLAPSANLYSETISLNFVRGSSGETTLLPADVAGVEAVANWNNSTVDNANAENAGITLVDDSGSATTATATWLSGDSSWSVPLAGIADPADIAMMTGYLDQGGDGAGQIHMVTISGIPYDSYEVYLYHSSAGGPNRTARYRANGADVFTRNLDPAGVLDSYQKAGYSSIEEAADLANPAGNYVVWENVFGDTLTIEAEGLGNDEGGAGGGTRRAPIQGIQIVAKTPGLPGVTTGDASEITVTSAVANGNLILNGADDDTATLEILWGTSDEGSDPDAWENTAEAGTLSAPGEFQAPLSGLLGNTVYYYRAFASNSVGDSISSTTQSFTTLPDPVLPEIENRAADGIGTSGATLNAELLNNGAGADPAEVTFYWGTSDGGTDTMAWDQSFPAETRTAPGVASAELDNLEPYTVYYFRASATNSAGPDWAPETSQFRTSAAPVEAISLNFVRGSSGETPLDPTDVAGVVPATNWNNSTTDNANNGTDVALNNANGIASGASATWLSGAASWSVATNGGGSDGDKKMMAGYLDQSGDGAGQIHTVTITGIPYPAYNVYLYHSSSGGPNRGARFQANGVDLFTRNLDPANTFDGFTNAQYESLALAADFANPAGNYVVWEGLSGDLMIEGEGLGDADGGTGGNTRRAPIQGIQIVPAGPLTPFQITDVVYNKEESTVALTFNSIAGQTYAIDSNTVLDEAVLEWVEVDDSIDADSESTTVIIPLLNPAPPKEFYRVRLQ